jgi:putative addiction module killer protein
MKSSYKAQFYQTEQGDVPLTQYLAKLRDTRAMVKISTRISRVETGNFGDHKSVGGGLWEMRIDYGPGYRVYYCFEGDKIVLLLCAGDKRTQSSDIETAGRYKADFERRNV